jgi:ammonia channel protein AmtB
MQTGFAMLEAGSLGGTVVVNILFKNFADTLVSIIVWFTCGFAFAFGGVNPGIGNQYVTGPAYPTQPFRPVHALHSFFFWR